MSDQAWSESAENRATLAVYIAQHGKRPDADTADGAWMYGEARDIARAALAAAHAGTLGLARSICVRDVDDWLRKRLPSGTTMLAEDRKHGNVGQTKGEYIAERFRAMAGSAPIQRDASS